MSVDQFGSVDLAYSDPLEPTIAVETIVARARRVRLYRRVRAGSLLVLVMVAAAGFATLINPFGSSAQKSLPAGPLTKLNNVVVVDASVKGWESFVYLSAEREVCGGTVGTSGAGTGHIFTTCGWASATDSSTGAWVMKPVFQAAPQPSENGDKALAIGLVRGNAVSVTVTFKGQTIKTRVVPIAGDSGLGAYAVWLPLNGSTSYGWNDIDSVVATRANGQTLAETH
jgi:hypothetical protein